MKLYVENPKHTTRKLPELINELDKVLGYKINIQYGTFLYTMYFHICISIHISGASQVAQWVKNPPVNAGDTGDLHSIPGLGRSPGG